MESIFIVGAGGIGCAVGYALRAAGAPVAFVEANPNKVRWGRAHGVAQDRKKPVRADFLHFESWQPRPGDTIILTTKCYDNAQVLKRLPAGVHLIPIQNGFDRELEKTGPGWEGIASFVSECDPDRPHTRITRNGRLHVGVRGASLCTAAARPEALIAALERHAPFRVEVVADILPYKYTKLMYNAAISPLAAAAGLDNGQLLANPTARRLFFRLIRENYAILKAANVRLGKIGPFHPDTVDRILGRLPVARFLAWVFYPTLRKTYCSMSGDLPRGRTEIDYYNRHLIDLAPEFPCPLNWRVYELVKRMEQERISPGLHVLDELDDRSQIGSGVGVPASAG
jgi:2-dehydropantoate 2-reductase